MNAPLMIIAAQSSELKTLEEAFISANIATKAYAFVEDIKEIEDNHLILAVLTAENKEKIQKLALERSVFVISDAVISEDNGYEGCFTRPVRLGQLVELIKQTKRQQAQHKALEVMNLGAFQIDPKTSQLRQSVTQKTVRLTEKELAVLILLAQKTPTPISRQDLLDDVWGYVDTVETHTLETHIYRLRQKIQKHLGVKDFLMTDDGYCLKF